jgi:hypothetical protein
MSRFLPASSVPLLSRTMTSVLADQLSVSQTCSHSMCSLDIILTSLDRCAGNLSDNQVTANHSDSLEPVSRRGFWILIVHKTEVE